MSERTIRMAREQRAAKAAALRQLELGHVTLSETLRRPPKALKGCDLYYVLLATPNCGRAGARQICEHANVWPHLRMGELTRAQRSALRYARPNRVM